MTADHRIARRAPLWLLAGPAVFLGAVLLGFVSNALVDRTDDPSAGQPGTVDLVVGADFGRNVP